ncbi:MAG: extensin family protein [Rhodoplanes sp.]|uniref:extensin-like domain-containing protein n=1 Tax=Rhodoplanes sp. TaxID=1968906 RepID=UPI0017F25C98|nr:extensin family protein [Rhodoplanes sp.]NVO14147.1 extensin family protein [Rhodoplanes sp.]
MAIRTAVLVLLLTATAVGSAVAAPQARREPARVPEGAAGDAVPLPVVVPLPRPRPITAPAKPPEPDPKILAERDACLERLAVVAEAEPEPPAAGQPACQAQDLVRLSAIRLAGGERVAVAATARIRCTLAEALVAWMRDDVAALMTPSGGRPATMVVDTSYECRPRNRIAGAKISEHGRGNAVDLRGFVLADGRSVGLTDPIADKTLRSALAKSVCARFTTVLGPGSDGYHEDHVHLDLAERRKDFRICQWDVRDPVPLPRPRPKLDAEPDSEPEQEP